MRVFGCVCFVHNSNPESKFDSKAIKCIFVGYSNTRKGYKCYSLEQKKNFISKDVTFHENVMYYSSNHNDQIISIREDIHEEEIQFSSEERNPTININDETISAESNIETQVNDINDKEVSPDIETIDENNDSISIRKSKRLKIPKKLYPIEEYVTICSIPIPKVYVANLSDIKIPKNIEEASMDERWKSAMDEEIYALEKNNTWEIVNVPNNKKTVGCKWLFNIKYKPDGNIDRFKARLVAKGYTQVYGIDYMETLSPVAKMTTIRILISLAACKNWNLYQ